MSDLLYSTENRERVGKKKHCKEGEKRGKKFKKCLLYVVTGKKNDYRKKKIQKGVSPCQK